MSRHVLSVIVAVLLAASCSGGGDGGTTSSTGAGSDAVSCTPYEATIDGVPEVDNPFDPSKAEVSVQFTGPDSSQLSVAAFREREFERALIEGEEVLTSLGRETWTVRATLPAPGAWTWQATITTEDGTTRTPERSVSCAEDPASRGVLVVDADNPRRLAWSDGTPYLAVGENLGWYGEQGTYDYDRWLEDLASHGATWIRVWMPSWAFGLEGLERDDSGTVIETSLGDYSARLDRAWQLDHVIDSAFRQGIAVQLVILNHGAFSTTTNSEWDDSPYNQANGGPLAEPTEVFSDPAARELILRRLRYVVARWGWAPNVIWELWNEVDLTGGVPSEVVAWHEEMAAALDEFDPYDHLVTTSISDPTDFLSEEPRWGALWELDGIDLIQVHLYGRGDELPIDFTTLVPQGFPNASSYGKPVLLAEAGVDFRGPVETLAADPQLQGIHELTWTGFFSGGYGSGMTWWWDNVIEPEQGYGLLLDGLDALLDDPAVQVTDLVPLEASAASPGTTLQVMALAGQGSAVVWTRNPANWWHQPDPATISDAEIVLTGIADGAWELSWVDPFNGAEDSGGVIESEAGELVLVPPPFPGEISARLVRL